MILCFELNLLDDLKIVDHRKFYVMHLANSFLSVSFNPVMPGGSRGAGRGERGVAHT